MHPTKEEFEETYRRLSEEDIAGLYAEANTLTDEAPSVLFAEMQRRGLRGAHLEKMHATEDRHEAQFDRLEKFRRKKLALWFSGLDRFRGMRLKDWLILLLISGLLIWMSRLIPSRH